MTAFFAKIKAFFAMIIAFFTALFGGGGKTTPEPPAVVPDEAAIIAAATDEVYFAQYFKPVLRFVAASDVHIDDSGSGREEERLAQLYETAYAYAASQAYNKLDGVFFAGDISNRGTSSSLDTFFRIVNENNRAGTLSRAILGNHEFFTDPENTVSRFLASSGYDAADCDLVLGGFHFILMCPDKNGSGFSAEKQAWLDARLAAAVAEDSTGTKPVFVFQHHHVKNTVYGSGRWGITDLRAVLDKYPQVVDISGHSHYPINDPRSIWQGTFTALGDGTLSYYEMGIAGVKDDGVYPTDDLGSYASKSSRRDAAQYFIVEVSKENALRILGYDILSRAVVCEYKLRSVGDPAKFQYTDARKAASEAPAFSAGDTLTAAAVQSDAAYLSIPQASCADQVQHYRFEACDAAGNLAAKSYSLADNFFFPAPETIYGKLTGLAPDTDYTVKCFAVSCWEKESAPLTQRIHTPADAAATVSCYDSPILPDVFSFIAQPDGTAYDGVSGARLPLQGYPNVTADEKTGRNAAVFTGWNSYRFDGFEARYDDIRNGVSFEFYGTLDALCAKDGKQYVNPFSNQGNGGCGFECSAAGNMQFWVSVNGSYVHPGAQVRAGVPVHVIGTFDGETVRVYINGELGASQAAAGEITFPGNASTRYLCIGGDSGTNGATEAAMTGRLVTANVYARALSAQEVALLYAQYR